MKSLTNRLRQIHIGEIIASVIRDRGLTYAEVARRLHVERTTIYSIVKAKSIDVERLLHLSEILDYDFIHRIYLPLPCGDNEKIIRRLEALSGQIDTLADELRGGQ